MSILEERNAGWEANKKAIDHGHELLARAKRAEAERERLAAALRSIVETPHWTMVRAVVQKEAAAALATLE